MNRSCIPGMFFVDAAQDAHLLFQHVAFLLDDALALDIEVHSNAARHDLVHQVAMAEQRGVVAQHLLLEYPELGEAERQRDVVAQIAEIAQMIGDTFAFQQQCTHPQAHDSAALRRRCFPPPLHKPRHRPRCCRRSRVRPVSRPAASSCSRNASRCPCAHSRDVLPGAARARR